MLGDTGFPLVPVPAVDNHAYAGVLSLVTLWSTYTRAHNANTMENLSMQSAAGFTSDF